MATKLHRLKLLSSCAKGALMNFKLKNLSEQVMVITGASSGTGLVTARLAAKRGARLVLNARNEDALEQIVNENSEAGGEAIYVAGDVGNFDDVHKIGKAAISNFG